MRRIMKPLIFAILVLALSLPVLAKIIHVPNDVPQIQTAINISNNGDTVLVADDVYYENINFKGKAITVASHIIIDGDTSHISRTIINGSKNASADSGSVVYFISEKDTTSILCGFTITGGYGTVTIYDEYMPRYGGGIYCYSGGEIVQNIIKDNHVNSFPGTVGGGGGILAGWNGTENVVIKENTIVSNSTEGLNANGGGISIFCNGKIKNNVISKNTVTSNGGRGSGGAIACFGWEYEPIIFTSVDILGNCMEHNKVIAKGTGDVRGHGGGLHCNYSNTTIKNNKIRDNIVESTNEAYGGGIFINSGEHNKIIGNFVYNNRIEGSGNYFQGGGIAYSAQYVGGSVTLSNNIIADNDVPKGYGGGLRFFGTEDNDQALLYNNTIVNNKANFGGGIRIHSALDFTMINSIVWGNTAAIHNQISDASGQIVVNYCDIEGAWEGESNIDVLPELYHDDSFASDTVFYCLSEGSPCIDAGNPEKQYIDLNDNENPGFPKWPANGTLRNDMGAYGGPTPFSIYKKEFTKIIENQHENTFIQNIVLFQNYPNPFNYATKIQYQLPVRKPDGPVRRPDGQKTNYVDLSVYNVLGQKVVILVSEKQPAGTYNVEWDAKEFANGFYLYRIETDNGFSQTKKLILMK